MEGELSDNAAWVGRNGNRGSKRPLTPAEVCLIDVVCRALRRGAYDLKWGSLRAVGLKGARFVLQHHDLATVDTDALTRLVFGAHDACARLSVNPGGPHGVEIMLHLRVREGSLMERHPTLEDAVAAWRRS